mmetsp:Transcript_11958/g.18038  ORF Transcript_11958/g.18038 Transcript_11958/m.18038 type:complete len:133 (+) Transcript_11958:137-535(+)
MQEAGIDKSTFRSVLVCPIAVEGEECPIITVSPSPGKCDIEGDPDVPEHFRWSFNLMSGSSIECGPQQLGATLSDLARTIVDKLPDHTQTSSKRVFITFDVGPECEPMAVTPWDWNRPLADFLPRLQQGHEA